MERRKKVVTEVRREGRKVMKDRRKEVQYSTVQYSREGRKAKGKRRCVGAGGF